MDYDDNEFQSQNCDVGGEGNSKFSPVLHPYSLPKFDFDDGLQGHLRFDNLVENEAFLGIQSQEDNQWIEDYSRGSGVFSSSAPEPCPILRSDNVWSEATSSESVEMLLKSVGQEETVGIAEESDACHKLGCVAEQMDSHFKEDDSKMGVKDSELTFLSEKTADHVSGLIDVESQGVDITIHGKSHILSPNALREPSGVYGIEDILDSRNDEENVSEVEISLDKFPVNEIQDRSDSNMRTEDEDTMSQHIIVNVGGLDNQESVSRVNEAGQYSADCLLTESVKKVEEDSIIREEVHVDGQLLEEIASETSGEILKNLSLSDSEIVELRPVEINVSKLDEPTNYAVVGAQEYDKDACASELNKGSDCDHADSSYMTQIHQQFDENIQNELPKDFQGNGDFVVHDVEVIAENADISAGSELKMFPTTEVTDNPEEGKVPTYVSDCQLGTGDSLNNNRAPLFSSLNNDVSDAQGDGTSVSFAVEDTVVTSTCYPTSIQDGKHSNEKSKLGDDASSVRKNSSAEDSVSVPTVSGSAALALSLNSVHHDQVVSSNGEEKPKFPNDSSETECDSVEPFNHEKRVGLSFNRNSCKNDEAVRGSEFDTVTSIEPDSNVPTKTATTNGSKGEKEETVEKLLVKNIPPAGSVKSALKEVRRSDLVIDDSSFTFGIHLSSGVVGECGQDKQFCLTPQSAKSCKEVSPSTPSVDPMKPGAVLQTPTHVSSPALDLEIDHGGLTSTLARKRGRPSGKVPGKQSAKKKNSLKETTSSRQSQRDNNDSSVSMSLSGTGQLQFEAVKLHEKFEQSSIVPYAGISVATPILPDLNTSASPSALFRQTFSDIQQMQLRAQIFVYGSLIQGAVPDETCMVAAFGTSDGGRNMWEPVWRACVERVQVAKSNLCKSENPLQAQSGSNPPKQTSTKKDALQSTVLPSPVGRANSMGTTSPAVNSMIPPSPLWNVSSTPFHALQSTGMPKSNVFDYRQTFSPSHPFQTPPLRNVTGNNTSWPSHASFPVPWINASQSSPFDGSARLPITETVKLTPIKEPVLPVASGARHTAVHHSGPSVSAELHPLPNMRNTTMPSGQKTAEPKSRKRKKITDSQNVNQIPLPAQARIECIPAPFPLFAQARTELIPAPVPTVIPSHLSTSVVVSTPPFFGSRGTDARIVATAYPSYLADQPKRIAPSAEQKSNLPDGALIKAEETKQQAVDVKKTTMASGQKTTEPKSRKKKKSTASENVNHISLPAQACFESLHASVPLFSQAQTELMYAPLPAPVTPSHLLTPVIVSTPPFFGSKGNEVRIVATAAPSYLDVQTNRVEPSAEQSSNLPVDGLVKVEEAKQQAQDAAALATAAVSHSQAIWDQLNKKKDFGLIPEVEAKLASAAVAVAAAAAVAKAAAAAARFASNAASQAKVMADEAWILSIANNPTFNSAPFIYDVGNRKGSATTSSNVGDEGNFSSSILAAAKEAARKRVEAASFASKRAENLDDIVKAAELAAAAVSQAGRIVAMGDPPSLAKLVEAGPQGYWRATQIPPEHPNEENSNIGSIQASPVVAGRHAIDEPLEKQTKIASRDMSPLSREVFKDSVDGMPSFSASGEKGLRAQKDSRASDLDEIAGVAPESETGARTISIISAQDDNTKGIELLKGTSIGEGSLVEVKKEGNGFKEAWFSANVLSVENGKAFVSYAASKSDLPQLKEWVALEGDSNIAPRIRISPPVTDIQYEGTRKRRRGEIGDYAWSVGDKVDVWVKECWREGVITDKNKIDVTTITVHFPAEGETSVVRTWHLRPTLIWKDGKWMGSFSSRQHEGDTPQEKRLKLAGPSIEGSKDNLSKTFQLPGPERPGKLQLLPLLDNERKFNVGNSIEKDSKLDVQKTVRRGLQKEGPKVVFGVPKPGKKKKFMEVSKHYVAESSSKADKLKQKYTMPKNDGKEKQQGDLTNKAPKPEKKFSSFGRTLPQKDKFPISAVSTKSEAKKSASADGSESEQEKRSKFGTVSSTNGPSQGSFVLSSSALSRNTFTPNSRSERVQRDNRAPAVSKSSKEVKDNLDAGKQIPEISEPRRSNRRIQPTSRLLEGLQSSLILPKFPSFAHDKGQRSRNRSTLIDN